MTPQHTTFSLFLSFLLGLLLPLTTSAKLLNASIDDEFGDSLTGLKPIFIPATSGIWEGEECTGCRVKPDPAFTFKNTYNAATYRPDGGIDPIAVDLHFNGTAIYVFFTLANNCGEFITTLTECNFTLDGTPPVFYRHEPNMSTTDYVYQAPVFSQEGLENTAHTLQIITSGPDYHIFVNFDYALYTYDDSLLTLPSSTSSSSQTSTTSGAGAASSTSSANINHNSSATGAIIGGIVGGIAIFAIIILLLFYFRRRHQIARTPKPLPLVAEFNEDYLTPYQAVRLNNGAQSNVNLHQGSFPPSFMKQGQMYQYRNHSPSDSSSPPAVRASVHKQRRTESGGNHHTQPSASTGSGSLSYTSPSNVIHPSDNNVLVLPTVRQDVSNNLNTGRLVPLRNPVMRSATASSRPHSPSPGSFTQRQESLNARIQTLQQAIAHLISDLRAKQDALTQRGVPEHEINTSLEVIRENLRLMAEQMAILQERRRNSARTGAPTEMGSDDVEEEPPGYISPTVRRGRIP